MIPEDVKELAPYVWSHRIVLRGVSGSENEIRFVKKILDEVRVPMENLV